MPSMMYALIRSWASINDLPMVVVMPYGYAFPPAPAFGSLPSQQTQRTGFVKDLLGDVIPFVEANYRVQTGRDQRAILGRERHILSEGGSDACGAPDPAPSVLPS